MEKYDDVLSFKFKDVTIELVNFDNGNTPESMCAYICVSALDKGHMKDKGTTALDLGNYLYKRYGLMYEVCPEYSRSGEPMNSLSFYISKKTMDRMQHVQDWILSTYNCEKTKPERVSRWESALYRGHRFIIQSLTY